MGSIGTGLAGTIVSLVLIGLGAGFAAVTESYRHGNVDVRAAVVIASMLFIGAWVGAAFANHCGPFRMKVLFGAFVVLVGVYTIFEALMARATA